MSFFHLMNPRFMFSSIQTHGRISMIFTMAILLFVPCIFVQAQPDPSSANNNTDPSGKKQGHWIKKDQAGRLIYEGQFKDDIPVGEFRYYYEDGKLRNTLKYNDLGKEAFNTGYHLNGKLMSEGNYVDKKKDGAWKYYNDAGGLVSEELYSNGIPTGTWKVYYEGLKVMEQFSYVDGIKEGPWKQFYPSGTLRLEASYSKGQLNGPAKYYFPDGALMTRGNYSKDVRTGIWESFKQDGSKESEAEYLYGKLISEEFFDKERDRELHQDAPELK